MSLKISNAASSAKLHLGWVTAFGLLLWTNYSLARGTKRIPNSFVKVDSNATIIAFQGRVKHPYMLEKGEGI